MTSSCLASDSNEINRAERVIDISKHHLPCSHATRLAAISHFMKFGIVLQCADLWCRSSPNRLRST